MGIPSLADCSKAYDKIPYALVPPGGPPDMDRLFVEPQYLQPPFSPVYNPYAAMNDIIQLPKIWRHGAYRPIPFPINHNIGFRDAYLAK